MKIRTVQNKHDLQEFIDLPYHFYHDDPVWIAPLRGEQRGQFDSRRNPLLDHCDYALFLLEDCGK